MWTEWQDRRQTIQRTLEMMQHEQQVHVDNLDLALEIIAKIGTLYNQLERSDQKDLLRQIVERVIVDDDGQVILELRTPFGYLNTLVDGIRREKPRIEKMVTWARGNKKRQRISLAFGFAPQAGFEPATDRLTADCSAVELLWNKLH